MFELLTLVDTNAFIPITPVVLDEEVNGLKIPGIFFGLERETAEQMGKISG